MNDAETDAEFFYRTPVLVLALLLFVGVGLFGAANWNCWVVPNVPKPSNYQTKEDFDAALECHPQRVDDARCGAGSVVPFVWSMPLTFVGLAGAVACVVVLIYKHSET